VSWLRAEANFYDETGANNTFASGTTSFTAGEVGSAFLFDGTANANHVSATTNAFPTGNAARTVEGWVRFDNVGLHPYQAVFAYGGTTANTLFAVALQSGNLIVDYQFASLSGPTITQGAVYHLAATYASGTVTLYLNGSQVAQGAAALNTTAGTQLTIGQNPSGVPTWTNTDMAGFVDELTIYNRALTPAEIQAINASGPQGKYAPCALGLIRCGNVCIDPKSNPAFCGASGTCTGASAGTACSGGQLCVSSACITPTNSQYTILTTGSLTNLTGPGNGCTAQGEYQNNCSAPFGFTWTDTGSGPLLSVSISFNLQGSCAAPNTQHAVTLNGMLIGAFANTISGCACGQQPVMINVAPQSGAYVVGGSNTLIVASSCCEGINNASGTLATVSVTY
jgi:hypothetical protein